MKTNFKTTSIKKELESKTSWMELGTMLYVVDYSKFINNLETEADAENNAYVYWETIKGIKFQDERSRLAYENNILILAES